MEMEAHIPQPLWWFGLLDHRAEEARQDAWTRYLYRKSTLFDRFLSFDVRHEATSDSRH
jgi:hypothetical protein